MEGSWVKFGLKGCWGKAIFSWLLASWVQIGRFCRVQFFGFLMLGSGLLWLLLFLAFLSLSEDSVFKVLKPNDHHGDVVQRPPQQWIFQDVFDSHATEAVDVLSFALHWGMILIIIGCSPHAENGVLIRKLIEYPVTAKNHEVMLWPYLKLLDLWIVDDYIRIPLESRNFRFWVTKCSGYTQPSGEDSEWARQVIQLVLAFVLTIIIYNLICCCPVVDLPTCILYSFCLGVTTWLMILAQSNHLLALLGRKGSSWITYVGHVAGILDDKHYNGAWSTFIS